MTDIRSERRYKALFFTKPLQALKLEETIEFAAGLGVDGLDLVVRENFPVTPVTVRETLPAAAAAAEARSLEIGMVTVPGEMTSPGDPLLLDIIEACGESGVPYVKLGYWDYQGHDYWGQVKSIRSELAELGDIASKAGVCVLLHTHSDTIAHSAALVHNLVDGFDPEVIGVYLDTCHITMRGENFDQAFDIVGNYLKAIAVKDALRIKITDDLAMEPFHLNMEMKPLGEGCWNIPRFIDALSDRNFAGPLSYHLEYDVDENEMETCCGRDLDFLRKHNLIR